jgi:hypothetical protein
MADFVSRIPNKLNIIAQILNERKKVTQDGVTSQQAIIDVLKQCGEEKVAANIAYIDKDGVGQHRHIDPYEWGVTGNSEKMWAYCRIHNETHSFIMQKIVWARKTNYPRMGEYPYIPTKGFSKGGGGKFDYEKNYAEELAAQQQASSSETGVGDMSEEDIYGGTA